jgi:hypothetical protein
MKTPESMKSELAAWNNGAGIAIEPWVACSGSFSLAVGYASVFWPEFTLFEGYILREGFSETSLRGFEQQQGINHKSVEWHMNHLHLADIQYYGCKDASKDKLLLLGKVLKEIYEAKLLWKWPDRPCSVELYIPDDEDDLMEYQLSFWQKCNE